MAKVYIFGSSSIVELPYNFREFLQNLINQGAEFVIKDNSTVCVAVQKSLSAIGQTKKATIVGYDYIMNNKYKLNEKTYKLSVDEEATKGKITNPETGVDERVISGVKDIKELRDNKTVKEFIHKTLTQEAALVICLHDGVTKNTLNDLEFVRMCNKPNYVITLQVS